MSIDFFVFSYSDLYRSAFRHCFYRAMLSRVRYCKSSLRVPVRLSARNVEVLWSHTLEYFENNFTVS